MNATTDWLAPHPVDAVTLAFPALVSNLMPPMVDIPDEFKRDRSPWNAIVSRWFFSGLKGRLVPKDGIDYTSAMRHLSAVMRSYEPKHEHKEAAVAYLLSLWFDRYEAVPAAVRAPGEPHA